MCYLCFSRYTDAPVVNDKVRSVARLIEDAGDAANYGFLHIYVADMNLDDHYFTSPNDNRREMYPKAEDWERRIFDNLGILTEAERASAIALVDGWIDRDGVPNEEFATFLRKGER